MSGLVVQPIHVQTRMLTSPGGITRGEYLASEACQPCLENSGYGEESDSKTLDLPLRMAAVLSVSGSGTKLPYRLCRSHSVMMLGEQRVTELLGEKR